MRRTHAKTLRLVALLVFVDALVPCVARAEDAVTPGPPASDPSAPLKPTKAELASFGMLAVLAKEPSTPAPSSWWLRDDLGPPDPRTPLGRMWSPSIDDAAGAPGLRLSGVGLSGGHGGGGAPRTTAVATVGGGTAALDIDAFDHRQSAVSGTHAARAVDGRDPHTPPDVIQRIIHDNLGRIRVCYDAALRTNPELTGRVAVKFVIARSGAVALASDAGSDLPDAEVVACVVRTFDSLSFPPSADSVVTVAYPFVFSPNAR